MVYIQGLSLTRVAMEMGYNYKYTCRLNGQALNRFDEKDEEKDKKDKKK